MSRHCNTVTKAVKEQERMGLYEYACCIQSRGSHVSMIFSIGEAFTGELGPIWGIVLHEKQSNWKESREEQQE